VAVGAEQQLSGVGGGGFDPLAAGGADKFPG
jgi:hypothetical protein